MSALDLDALERLTRAYADAHAAMLADDRSAQAWLDDEAASKALAAHYGGQWASPAQCVDVLALITRLRAAEARTAWADSLELQAHSMATAIDQADEDGGLDSLGPVTAAIIRSDVARMLEIVAECPAAPEAPHG